jgi:hypothetical protein
MRRICTILLVLFSLLSCGQNKKNNTTEIAIDKIIRLDTSQFTIINYDNTKWIFENCKSTTLSSKDLDNIDSLVEKCIEEYNPKQKEYYKEMNAKYPKYDFKEESFLINLKKYKRQYVAVVNKKGEKEVWINCFCETWNSDWKKEIMMVDDGGKCFFNLKINLSKLSYYQLRVNGEA